MFESPPLDIFTGRLVSMVWVEFLNAGFFEFIFHLPHLYGIDSRSNGCVSYIRMIASGVAGMPPCADVKGRRLINALVA